MNNPLESVTDAADFTQAREALGAMLHLEGPAPAAVTKRALVDERFAMYLMMTRDMPTLREQVLGMVPDAGPAAEAADAEAADAADAADAAGQPAAPGHSTAALLARGSAAFLRWGRAGFRKAEDQVAERRLAACAACPHLADPPETVLYRGVKLLAGRDAKICSACGCAVKRKAAMPTERCPMPDPDDPTLSRWGEPYQARK